MSPFDFRRLLTHMTVAAACLGCASDQNRRASVPEDMPPASNPGAPTVAPPGAPTPTGQPSGTPPAEPGSQAEP
jgi:hypothetical protein